MANEIVAAEVAGTGVTVNAVCPAFVRTDMTAESIDRIVASTGKSADEAETALAAAAPPNGTPKPAPENPPCSAASIPTAFTSKSIPPTPVA